MKKLNKPKPQKKSEENKTNTIRRKEIIDRTIKDRIIRDIWILFETEEEEKKKLGRERNQY